VATKKVRRRRAKLQRHEYEYVVETEEGEEVPLERPSSAGGAKGEKPVVDRRGRVVQKPSLQRTMKRAGIFLPLIVVVVFLLGGNLSTQQKLVQAIFMAAIFLPFSHLMDVFMYRSYLRRQARQDGQRPTGRKE
jgi:hypothetical protein